MAGKNKAMIRVGYCAAGGSTDIGATLAAHPAFHPVRETIPVDGDARRCPAFNDYVLSAFNISVNYDLRFRVVQDDHGHMYVEFDEENCSLPSASLGRVLNTADIEHGIVQLGLLPFWIFISDDPDVVMTVQSAQGQTNPEPIRGQFNIYEWFRGTSYAFRVEFNQWVRISQDSPIYQVKFYHPSETRFSVGEIEKTPLISERERYGQLHVITGPQRWKEVWAFNRRRRPKHVLNFLKDS